MLSVLLGFLCGCRATARAAGPDEGAHALARASRAADSDSPGARAPNRDPHGHPDVDHYVARLASPDRIAELRVADVVAKLALAEDAIVGDLGCGPGIFAIAFARAVPEGVVLASDVEPGQLDALRAAIEAEGVRNVVPVLSSYGDPHFPPDRLDLMFVGDTYHHLRDRVAYFRVRCQFSTALKRCPKG